MPDAAPARRGLLDAAQQQARSASPGAERLQPVPEPEPVQLLALGPVQVPGSEPPLGPEPGSRRRMAPARALVPRVQPVQRAPAWPAADAEPGLPACSPVERQEPKPSHAGHAGAPSVPGARNGCASLRLRCYATSVPHWGGCPCWELPSATASSCRRHQFRRACRRYQPCNSRLPCECSHPGSLPIPKISSSGSGFRGGQRLPRRSLTHLAGNVTSQSFGSQHRRLGCAPFCERSMYHIFDAECQTHLAGIE